MAVSELIDMTSRGKASLDRISELIDAEVNVKDRDNTYDIGDVKGKNVIILDDMVDTAGTITKAADLMIENGALSVRAFASHGVLSDPATERIEKSKLTAIYFTDSIPLKKESEKIKVLSVAELIANTIINVNTNKSISSSYLV